MPPFRFHIPFFSTKSPSRLSSGTSSPSPPPTPSSHLSSGTSSSSPPGPPRTPPSRPPFRPAGIAQPKSNVSPSLKRVKSNASGIAASSSTSQSPSRGPATPAQLAKQQSGSPLKNVESLRTEEQKVTMKERPPRETGKVSGQIINPETQKPPNARPEEHFERKEAKTVQEPRKETETEKLAVQERKKALKEKSETDKEQQKRKDKENLAVQESKRALQVVNREDATNNKTKGSVSLASESKRDVPERETKAQIRTEIHKDDNNQKTKGASTSKIGNPRATSGEGTSSMGRKIKEDIRDGISKLTWGKSNGDEKSVSVFTLTGENRGATMGIGSEKDKKDGEVPIRRGYRSNPEESPNTTATETEEGKRPCKGKNPKDHEEEETKVKAYVNGNSQGINNSILVECSVSENDPGVHMSLKFEISKKDIQNPPEIVVEKKPETVKTTVNTRNEPRVRRRCLRGLLAESSESDPENPLKPRRHGCRFTCKDKDIENS